MQKGDDAGAVQVSASGFDQRSHDIAHHVFQKSAAADRVDERVRRTRINLRAEDRAARWISRRRRAVSEAAKAVKSCSPSKSGAASIIAGFIRAG